MQKSETLHYYNVFIPLSFIKKKVTCMTITTEEAAAKSTFTLVSHNNLSLSTKLFFVQFISNFYPLKLRYPYTD